MAHGMTLADQALVALAAYDDLASLAEDIEDEWTYVTDLSAAWRERIEALVDGRGTETISPVQASAISRAVDEIGRIERSASGHRLALDVSPDRARHAG